MFFKGKATRSGAGENGNVAALHWDRPGRRTQSFHIVVSSWQFYAHPILEGRRGGRVGLSLEGTTRLASCSGVAVSAEIKVTEDPDTAGAMSHRWKNVPPSIEGYGAVSIAGDGSPRLDLTLYCHRDFVEHVWRAFVTGFSSADSNVVLDLTVGFPDQITQDFWTTRWLTETMQVHEWKARAGAARTPPP